MKGRKSFLLRLPPDLLQEIKAWAEQELRSVNGQIEFILRDAIRIHRRQGGSGKNIDNPTNSTPEK